MTQEAIPPGQSGIYYRLGEMASAILGVQKELQTGNERFKDIDNKLAMIHDGQIKYGNKIEELNLTKALQTDLETHVSSIMETFKEFPCKPGGKCKYEVAVSASTEEAKAEAKDIRKEKRDWWGTFKMWLIGALFAIFMLLLGYLLRS